QDGYKNDVPTTVNKKRHGLEFTEVDVLKARVRYLEITKQIDKFLSHYSHPNNL
ncbi:unnamed protein product, partial [Brassica oleracea var. botrytis]